MNCPNCGQPLLDDGLFCRFCGTEQKKVPVCHSCGAELLPDSVFCSVCGTPVAQAPAVEEPVIVSKDDAPAEQKTKRRISAPAVILSGFVVLMMLLVVLLVRLLEAAPAPKEEPAVLTPADAAGSVLYLECYDSTGEHISNGSGFLIEDGKTLVTNYHVIHNVYSIKAFYKDGGYAANVKTVLCHNEAVDLAVLELSRDTKLQPLTPGDDSQVKQGDKIYAIGYPLGKSNTLSDGIVSSVYKEEGVDIFQITAPVSHGSSGGALLNEDCQVIGVVYAAYEDGQNMNLAVTIHELQALMQKQFYPLELEQLYRKSHPQLSYDSYRVGLKSIWAPTSDLAEEIYDIWLLLEPTEENLELLAEEYHGYDGCEYRSETEYIELGEYNEEFDSWCFDPDRNFGDVYWAAEDDGSALFFFYEVEEIVSMQAPAEGSLEEPSAEEVLEEEPAAEETPVCTHVWSTVSVRQTPDCTTDGVTTVHCTKCRAWENRTLPKLGHSVVTDEAGKDATCTAAGTTAASHCARCGAVISTRQTIAALGHTYTAGTCTRCGAKDPNYVPPKQEEEDISSEEQDDQKLEAMKSFLNGVWIYMNGAKEKHTLTISFGKRFVWTIREHIELPTGERVISPTTEKGGFTIDGNMLYFTNGSVGQLVGNVLYVDGLQFTR